MPSLNQGKKCHQKPAEKIPKTIGSDSEELTLVFQEAILVFWGVFDKTRAQKCLKRNEASNRQPSRVYLEFLNVSFQ